MSDTELQRWEEIVEREMLGEPIGEEDLAFCREYERAHSECAREREAWSGMLDGLVAEAEVEGHERAQALASRVLVARDVEREVVRPLRPTQAKGNGVRNAIVALAAAAAVAAIVSTSREATHNEPHNARAETRPAPRAPEVTPPTPPPAPAPAPAPSADTDGEVGRLALAGEGVRIDGRPATAGALVRADQPLDFAPVDGERGASACVVRTEPWITTCFSQGSALAFADSDDGMAVQLERGRVVVTLDSLAPGQRFEVVTSHGSVAAIGTSFEVWIDARGTVHASVLEGRVQVRDALGERPLAAGESTRLGSPETGPFAADALAWSRAHVETAALWRGTDPGVLVLAADDGSPSASVNVDALAVGHAPMSLLLPAGEHLITQAGSARGVPVEIEAGATRELALAGPPEAHRPTSARPRPTVEQLVRMASDARGAHRYKDAARHLDRILREYPDGPDAQNARVERADLSLDKLGNPNKAVRLYEAYLQRGGDLVPEARHGRIRALERLGRERDEREAIDAFLAEHPGDWRAKQLRERRERLSRG